MLKKANGASFSRQGGPTVNRNANDANDESGASLNLAFRCSLWITGNIGELAGAMLVRKIVFRFCCGRVEAAQRSFEPCGLVITMWDRSARIKLAMNARLLDTSVRRQVAGYILLWHTKRHRALESNFASDLSCSDHRKPST